MHRAKHAQFVKCHSSQPSVTLSHFSTSAAPDEMLLSREPIRAQCMRQISPWEKSISRWDYYGTERCHKLSGVTS